MIKPLLSSRSLATAFAVGRLGYAAGLLATPRAVGQPWVGPDAARKATQVALRGLAARDLAASAALLLAARRDESLRSWLLVCAVGDLGDVTGTALAARDMPRARLRKGLTVAGATAAAGLALAWRAGRD